MKSEASSFLVRNRRRATALLGRFGASARGATAVEFSIVALPFLMLLFAVLELGLIFMISTSLEDSTGDVARRIRTGEMQTTGVTAASFKQQLCDEIILLNDCATRLKVDVRTFDQFDDMDEIEDPINEEGEFDDSATTFQPGGAEDIVLVRAYYKWTLITPLMNESLQSLSDGSRLITASVAFRNEPYQ